MTTLHDRLADLAEDGPEALPAPGLWDRGVRYRRRRRAGTVVVVAAAVVALAVLGSVSWLRSPRAVEPLPASGPAGLPDRLYGASPWLPGTDEVGELGQLAAVVTASRGSWDGLSSELRPIGVSAVTGEYRFLDLPDIAYDSGAPPWTLSPDGRHLAYLYREPDADLELGLATGLALYDTATGAVRRHALPADLGIGLTSLVWAGSDTVVLGYSKATEVFDSGYSSLSQTSVAWDVTDAEPHAMPDLPVDRAPVSAGPGYVVASNVGSKFFVADVTTGSVVRSFVLGGKTGWFAPVLDDAAQQFAVMPGNRTPNWFFYGSTAASPVQLHKVTEERSTFTVLAWADDQHVAVRQRQADSDPISGLVLFDVALVDVATGESKIVVHDTQFGTQVASDLLTQPTVDAVEPPHPLDPRKATGLGVGIVLAAGWLTIYWRRRVRP